ncbi:DUF4271 domain-containing protein [Dyadobacter fermentans]|uniref:DUF4271 domain-containing protein n=1 Tax=Dyadobacter fermentans (strain ATCC 700827 / DSM 18053 / CIP 107007 / KCTC 52180 / NS114) TaxID=471854 RepID=C6W4M6_DYAFD|nr:DUF4271 domain-containing protein [Dyadobacter fermentans]ACT94127.1 hypothetical protein Dfer_2912 [Dyadobacter fermentans DSM 18053]
MKSIFYAFFWAFVTAIGLLGTSAHGAAKVNPPSQFFPVYNYQDDWLIYNENYKNYVPFSQGINEGTRFASLYIDLVKNRRYSLLVHSEDESYLFLEGALQSRIEPGQWRELNLDSLYRVYRKDELLLTLYGSPGIGDKTVIICNKKKLTDSETIAPARSGFINIKPIPFTPFGTFAGIALIIILILNAWIFNLNPLSFIRLINPIEFFNNDPRDQLSKINKPYSNTVIFFVVISSMMMSFTVIYLSINRLNLFSVSTILSEKTNTLQILGDFCILTLIFFLLIYAKYVFMVLAGNMLNLDKQVDIVFIKIVQSSYLFYALIFLVIFGLYSNHINWLEASRPYVLLPFLFFYLARFVGLYVVAKPAGSLINLYLFSYLCVIEIIPLIVSMKFAL